MYEEDPSQRGRVLFGHLSDCQQVRSPALAVLLSMNSIMLRMNMSYSGFCRRDSSILPYGPTAKMLRDSDPERACAIKCFSTDSKEVFL